MSFGWLKPKSKSENKALATGDFFNDMQKDFDTMLDRFFGRDSGLALSESQFLPKVDYQETDDKVTIKAELPGLSEKEFDVSLQENVLVISGERKEEKEEKKDKGYFRKEMHYGRFQRSIALPENILQDKVKAKYKKGILTVEVEKDAQKAPVDSSVKIKVN